MMRRTMIALVAVAGSSALGYVMERSMPNAIPIGHVTGPARSFLFDDPLSPVIGNPQGTLTIVEFYDYRCPYCRVMRPRLRTLLADDKAVRLILKEWPIFGGISIYAAKVALASAWQGRFAAVHDALFALPRTIDRSSVRMAARGAGVDLARLDRDMASRALELDAALARNDAVARSLGFQGTPDFVIGAATVVGAISEGDLRRLVAKQKAAGPARVNQHAGPGDHRA